MNNTLKKILVVDDNVAYLTLIDAILSDSYKVHAVDSGASALKYLEKEHPDLILLDLEMPEIGGDDLLRIIKADPEISGIPVIFLTAHNNIEIEAAAFRAGASDYIRKPIIDVIMLTRVAMHLELDAYRKTSRS